MEFKPMRDLVLVKQKQLIQEEKTESGLILIKGGSELYNFKEDEDDIDVIKPTSDLTWRLQHHARKKAGIAVEYIATEAQQNKLEAHEKSEQLKDIVNNKSKNEGNVVAIGYACAFIKESDEIIFRNNTQYEINEDGEDYLLVNEKDILVKRVDGKLIPNNNYVIVKISKESRDDLFSKKIKRPDGSEVRLFVANPPDKNDATRSEFFVSTGMVMAVGNNVVGVKENDLAILDYTCDNNDDIIVGYENGDKLIAILAVTLRHTDELIVYQNRRSNRDQIVHSIGDIISTTELLGVIRDEELYAIDPYVFLNHASHVISRKSESGLVWKEEVKIMEHEILAVSDESKERFGINKGQKVLVDNFDIFDITIDGKKISCVNDVDVLADSNLLDYLKTV